MRLGFGSWFERGEGDPLVLMTQRIRLDAYLAERAADAGAELCAGVKVTSLAADANGVEVVAGDRRFRAETVVGADGVNGICGRALGLGGNQAVGVALEGNVPYERLGDGYRGRAVLELGIVPGGYGWVFPKGDHANIGLGGWEREGPRLRERLGALCAAHGVTSDDLEGVRGYRLPLRSPRSTLARGRAAIVGDAAGLVDPVSGDGMFEAFLSGRLAADAVLDVLAGRAEKPGCLRRAADRSAGHAPLGLLGRESGARPLSEDDVPDRPLSHRLADGREARARGDRRRQRGARPRPPSAEGTRGACAGGSGTPEARSSRPDAYDASVQNYLLTTLDGGTRVVTEPLPASARRPSGSGSARARGTRATRTQE